MFFSIRENKNMRKRRLLRVGRVGGGRGQRDSRGRSLEFMMRLESRFRLSVEKHKTLSFPGLVSSDELLIWHHHIVHHLKPPIDDLKKKKKNPSLRGFQFNIKLFDEVWSLNTTPTLVKVKLLVGRSVAESFDVHQVTVHVRVVQRAERHVCTGEGQKCQQHVKCWFDKRFR